MDLKALTVEKLKSDLEALRRCWQHYDDLLTKGRYGLTLAGDPDQYLQAWRDECARHIAAIEAELAERELAGSPQGHPCWTCGRPTIMHHLPPDGDSPSVHYLRCSGKDEACITGGYHPSAQAAIANYPRRDTAEAERAEPKPAPAPALPPCYTCGEPLTIVQLGLTDKRPMEFYLACTGKSRGCIIGGDWPTEAEAIAHYPRRESVNADLLAAVRLGRLNTRRLLKHQLWPDRDAITTDLAVIEAAIAKAEGKP